MGDQTSKAMNKTTASYWQEEHLSTHKQQKNNNNVVALSL